MSENIFESVLTDILVELRMIRRLLEENEETPTQMGWDGLGSGSNDLPRSLLVDFCKRIEWPYREGLRVAGKSQFIPYARTESLVREIFKSSGSIGLNAYIDLIERKYQENSNSTAFIRPERMREHWLMWTEES